MITIGDITIGYDVVMGRFIAVDGNGNNVPVVFDDIPTMMASFSLIQMSNFFNSLNSSFQMVNSNVLNVDQRVQGVSSNISDLIDVFDSLDCSVDFTPLFSRFDNVDSSLQSLQNSLSSVDFSSLENFITANVSEIRQLIEQFNSNVQSAINSVSALTFESLNGSHGSYPDGSVVAVEGYTNAFKVKASFLMKNDANQYIIVYKLEDSNDASITLFCPNVYVKLVSSTGA